VSAVFGTDGVRGRFGVEIHGALAWWVGFGAAQALGPGVIAVARDTRPSGPALAQAVVAGALAGGADVVDLGVLPTPALGWIVRERGYAGGVVVTASHNLAADNGLKVLMRGGDKANAAVRAVIEAQLARSATPLEPGPRGRMAPSFEATTWQPCAGVDLRGVHVVFDGANGAAHGVGAERLRAAGARVTTLGDGAGARINKECGATHPDVLAAAVVQHDADVGIAVDGDGDRLAIALRSGRAAVTLDGDAMLWALAEGLPAGAAVVGTIMSNLGLQRGLEAAAVRFVRTAVGDAEVWDGMVASGARFGGEPSGHLMFRGQPDDPVGSCGLFTASRVLGLGVERLRARLLAYRPAVQRHASVRVADANGVAVGTAGLKPAVAALVEPARAAIAARGGRVVVRPSGTEPIIRVMVEHEVEREAESGLGELVALLKGAQV